MKKSVPNIAVLYSMAIVIASFSICNQVNAQAKTAGLVTPDATVHCFVQFNDGSIKQYVTLKLVTGILITPHLLADEKIVINAKDIKAYRNDKYFAVSDRSLTTKKSSLVALETLPGFAVKVISGKLNVYTRKYYNGNNAVDEYFLQNGHDGPIVAYSTNLMKTILKDNVKALEFYNSKAKVSSRYKKLLASANLYNSDELVSKN